MAYLEFFGYCLIAFGPSLAMFCLVIANDPIRIIIMISACFFWLVSLLLSSILWTIVVPLKEYLLFGVTFSILFQETFRYLFYQVLRKAETGLQKVAEVGRNGSNEIQPKLDTNRMQLSFVSGVGFGVMSGVFSLINILADATGPGTVGLDGGSTYFFLCASLTTLAFILLHICWTIILFKSCDSGNKPFILFVLISHLAASYITFLNPSKLYAISIPMQYLLLVITFLVTLKCADFRFDQFSSSASSIGGGGGISSHTEIKPIIPSQHLVIIDERPYFVLCKPKLLPLKSIALLQVESIQREAEEKIKLMQQKQ
ncbi:Aph1ap [Dermatophagoides farinae]|uniref:Aph1ap n=1 Tax=Dermatophagoides farinae TaxID=6954 RepID=A0A922L797_DERFA|nr:Aph1ap [Dermatophagoides farinae]